MLNLTKINILIVVCINSNSAIVRRIISIRLAGLLKQILMNIYPSKRTQMQPIPHILNTL